MHIVHRWNCGKTKDAKCEICDTVFKSPYVVQVHFNQTHREKRFKCDKCSEAFAFKSSLKCHKENCDTKEEETQEKSYNESNKVDENNEDTIFTIKLRGTDVFKIANVRENGLKGREITPQSQIKLESETTIKVEENDVILLETKESNEFNVVKNEIDEMTYILGI